MTVICGVVSRVELCERNGSETLWFLVDVERRHLPLMVSDRGCSNELLTVRDTVCVMRRV